MKIEHVCGLSGYSPWPPYNDSVCVGCRLRFVNDDALRARLDACPTCTTYRACSAHDVELAEMEHLRARGEG